MSTQVPADVNKVENPRKRKRAAESRQVLRLRSPGYTDLLSPIDPDLSFALLEPFSSSRADLRTRKTWSGCRTVRAPHIRDPGNK